MPPASALEGRWTGFHELPLPLGDLHRMHSELGGQLVQGLLPLDRLQRHLRFELAAMSASHGSHTSEPSSLTPLSSLLLNVWACPVFGEYHTLSPPPPRSGGFIEVIS